MTIKDDIKGMTDQDICKLKELLDREVIDRMIEKKAEYLDRFKDLFNDARQDGIALGVSAPDGDLLIAHSYNNLYTGKWQG